MSIINSAASVLSSIPSQAKSAFSSFLVAVPELVRECIALTLVGGLLYMQWNSAQDGAVPAAMVSAAGIASGYYLVQERASIVMKAFLSILYVSVFTAFLMKKTWLPDSLNAQVSTILGIWFAKEISRQALNASKE